MVTAGDQGTDPRSIEVNGKTPIDYSGLWLSPPVLHAPHHASFSFIEGLLVGFLNISTRAT